MKKALLKYKQVQDLFNFEKFFTEGVDVYSVLQTAIVDNFIIISRPASTNTKPPRSPARPKETIQNSPAGKGFDWEGLQTHTRGSEIFRA